VRPRRGAALAASISLAVGVLIPSTAAGAEASASVYYVNNAASASCSDSTANSAVTPYCTIQAAVTAATTPGDTVIVKRGQYAPFTVSSSGTAADPITIESTAESLEQETASVSSADPPAEIIEQAAGAVPLSVTGASYVTIVGFNLARNGTQSDAAISDSSHITLDRMFLHSAGTGTGTDPAVSIDSGSSFVTLSRSEISLPSTAGIVLATGGSNDTITTNLIAGSYQGPGIALRGTVDSAVTANTLSSACGAGISVTDGSTGTSIENNIVGGLDDHAEGCAVPDAQAADLLVDASSTSGTTADFNDAYTDQSTALPNLYSWAGDDYTSPAAFLAVTGQGAHDSAVTTNSANSDAPGELTTDAFGDPWIEDPDVAVTGAGAHPYYDRGASAVEDPLTVSEAGDWPTLMPVSTAADFTLTFKDGWGSSVTGCTYDFGDDTPAVSVTATNGGCTAQHSYTAAGKYELSYWDHTSNGSSQLRLVFVDVVAVTALTASLSASPDGARGLAAEAALSGDWNVTSCVFAFGDGTSTSANTENPSSLMPNQCGVAHSYARSGTYTVTVTVTDAGGNHVTTSTQFSTAGQYYTPTAPTRILDTRSGTGVAAAGPLAAGGTLKLKIAGVAGVPSGAGAVALNVTVTQPTATGVITVYADGTPQPGTSNINYVKGQTIADTVLAQVGTDGYVDLTESGSGTTQVVADLAGYYSLAGAAGYTPVTPVRMLDTRGTSPVPAGGTVKVSLASYGTVAAATMNLTVTGPTATGTLVAYPDGAARPATSNLDFTPSATVANEAVVQVGSDGAVDFTNTGSGTVNLMVDLTGYFTGGSGNAYVPLTPARFLDTRNGTGVTSTNGLAGGLPGRSTGDLRIEESDQGPYPQIPPSAAVTATVTAIDPATAGDLVVYPDSLSTAPGTSTVAFAAAETIADAVSLAVGPVTQTTGGLNIYNAGSGTTQLLVDVSGYYD